MGKMSLIYFLSFFYIMVSKLQELTLSTLGVALCLGKA